MFFAQIKIELSEHIPHYVWNVFLIIKTKQNTIFKSASWILYSFNY